MTITTGAFHPQIHVELAAEIVSAYVAHNSVPAADLPGLLGGIHAALVGLGSAPVTAPSDLAVEKPSAAQIRKSITPEGITSFIDGKVYKTLKRHLTSHNLTPDAYRSQYGLAADYPLVCASYAAQRSALAKAIGLGVPGARASDKTKDGGTLKKAA